MMKLSPRRSLYNVEEKKRPDQQPELPTKKAIESKQFEI